MVVGRIRTRFWRRAGDILLQAPVPAARTGQSYCGRNGRLGWGIVTPRTSHHRSRKRRADARRFRKIEIAITAEIDQSLIDSFPASDPPSWVALARVGIPNRKGIPSRRKG